MKVHTLAVSNLPTHHGLIQLKKSLIRHSVQNTIIITPWQGFFTKVNEAYKFCKETDADWLLFLDGHDTVMLDGIDSVIERLEQFDCDCVFSGEKAIWPTASAWPDPELAKEYPEVDSPWRYLNSGTYLIKPQLLIELVDTAVPVELKVGMDDQMYWGHQYLLNKDKIVIDTNCEIFQTLAHDSGESFDIVDGKFTNLVTGTNPVILHANGNQFELMSKYI